MTLTPLTMLSILRIGASAFGKLCTRKSMIQSNTKVWSSHTVPRMCSKHSVARITMPHQSIERLEKKKSRASKSNQIYHKGSVVISCHRKKFNHYKGQRSTDLNNQNLASRGWKHYKSVGDYFTINPTSGHPALNVQAAFSHFTDFSMFDLNAEILKALNEQNIAHPTNIQAMMLPAMMTGANIMCTAETGSGKTLAYLLPIINRIMEHKQLYKEPEFNTPYAVVVVPNRELAEQLQSVADDMLEYTSCKAISVCGGRETSKLIQDPPQHQVDLLIATPGVLRKLLLTRVYHQSRLMHIVFDEADTLMDDSFRELTTSIIQLLQITSEKINDSDGVDIGGTQVVLVSATLPTSVQQVMTDIVPMDTIKKIQTSRVHDLMPHVSHKFMRVNGTTKIENFLKIVKSNPGKRTIVFCKNSQTVCYVGLLLKENGVENVIFHANMPQKIREGRFQQLQDGTTNILVATDVASRGLDTLGVSRIINFDLPTNMSDYIHRSGRVGRIGSTNNGSVVSFIQHAYEVETLWKIEQAARSVSKLSSVNANIKRKHTYRHEKLQEERDLLSVLHK